MHNRVIEKIAEAFVRNNIPAPRWDSKRIKVLLRYLARVGKAVDQYFGPNSALAFAEADLIQRVHIRITAERIHKDGPFEQTESVSWTTSGPNSVSDPMVASHGMRMQIKRATLVKVFICSPYDLYHPRAKNLTFRFKMGG